MQKQERILEALEMIVCPVCKGRLGLEQSHVQCAQCGREYPIEDGIPVLLEARATRQE